MPKRRKDKHLPPCVYLKHGAYWYVKKNKWTRLGTTLHEAMGAYSAMIAQPGEGMVELIDKVLADIKPRPGATRVQIAQNTYEQYVTCSRHLKQRLRDFAPRQVEPRDVAAIKRDMQDTPNMFNRCLSFLGAVFDKAIEWQLVPSNPCSQIKRLPERKRDRYITDEEWKAIYDHADTRLQVIMDLLYLTGQRVEDVLHIHHADLDEHGIRFRPMKTENSTGAKILVRWTPDLTQAVARAKSLRGNVRSLTLLSGRGGKAPNYRTVNTQWAKACRLAGVSNAQMRDIRAKALTDAQEQGHNPTDLAAHSSPQMTARYLRRHTTKLVSGPSRIQGGSSASDSD